MSIHKSTPNFDVIFEGDPKDGWMHSGIAILSDGRLVFEAAGGHGLVFLDVASHKSEKIAVDIAVAHGIATTFESGQDFIWICDPGAQAPGKVVKINLQGEIVKELTPPQTTPNSSQHWRPTSVAVADNGDIWVADGYGISLVHCYRTNGEVLTLDGSDSGSVFNCPHGIAIDKRSGKTQIVVADRRNKRVLTFDETGKFLHEVTAEVITTPSSLAVSGDDLFVTDLYGAIIKISKNGAATAQIPSTHSQERPGWPNKLAKEGSEETIAPTIEDGCINSPHGIVASKDGVVYATEWFFGGRVLKLH